MKLLIASDIHGNFLNMKKVIQDNSDFDYLVLLGDILEGPSTFGYDKEKLANFLNIYKNKIIAVRGNCDYDISLLEFNINKNYLTIPFDNKIFFLTHGHYYNKYNMPDIEYDIFLSGHTHVAKMEKEGNKLFLNPGSLSLPRSGNKSYMIYQDGIFYLKDLDKNEIIKKVSI